ncbi:MAG: hypothetical protein WAZ77_07650 [Candidatus Nitrosopolaris sp.]|jgi:hypothetical protein
MCLYQVVKILDKQLANDYLLPPGRIPMTKESTARQKEWRDMKIMELDSQFKSGKQHISHTLVGTVIKKQRQLAKEHMSTSMSIFQVRCHGIIISLLLSFFVYQFRTVRPQVHGNIQNESRIGLSHELHLIQL